MSAEEDRQRSSTVHSQAPAPAGAVFLSYASEDADAAERIASALRSAGIQVWFDKSELRGGDVWDRQIRQQIQDCRLFIAVISAHTEVRDEGYFRREWRLAVERAGDMAEDKAFVVPVAVDGTSERSARVPDSFKHVQWTRLPAGETPPAFVQRVQRLLAPQPTSGPPASTVAPTAPAMREPTRASWRSKAALAGVIAVLGAVCVYLLVARPWVSKQPAAQQVTASAPASPVNAASFSPPPHSIAVLPFVNMSGDKEQEYFSEGLTEELLNSLARINELQVAARTSSFSFQGEHPDIATVAHKLNVGAVLEGSVRRSAHTVRVTAQLINGVTGFHVWSQTYDRDLGDVLKLQTDIANAVAGALKVALLADVSARIELGATRNPAALDAYFQATKSFRDPAYSRNSLETAIANYTNAIELDPKYALAYAGRSVVYGYFALDFATGAGIRAYANKAEADARKALALAPDLALGHLALADAFETALDFGRARSEYQRAISLEPGNATIQHLYGTFAVLMGDAETGLNALRRSLVLDPLNADTQDDLGLNLLLNRRYVEALEVLKRAHELYPREPFIVPNIGVAQYLLGDYQGALKSCEQEGRNEFAQSCLAITYDKLGRHADAEAAFGRVPAPERGLGLLMRGWIFAQWGQTDHALDSLETAMRLRSPYLEQLKMAPLYDPIRNEPRFQAIERELKFPE